MGEGPHEMEEDPKIEADLNIQSKCIADCC